MTIRGSASSLLSEKRNLIGVHSCKGKEWIRLPSIIYAVSMISGVIIILSEEAFGQYHTSHLPLVISPNPPCIIFPLTILSRLRLTHHPFPTPVESRLALS